VGVFVLVGVCGVVVVVVWGVTRVCVVLFSFFLLCVVVCLVVGRGVCMSSSRVTWLLFGVTLGVLLWGVWAVGGLDDACLRGRTVC
jgi:hypothetical protein